LGISFNINQNLTYKLQMIKIFPFIFVILWSSAFVTTKPIINNSDPFAALAFRFFFVALGFLVFAVITKQKILTTNKILLQSIFSGVLFHGVYLGGVFYSVSIGVPTGIVALIVTLQPILTNALAGKFLDEDVSLKQWIGVILGFFGAVLVLGFDIGTSLPVIGVLASFVALLAITSSTLWQKKVGSNFPLSVSNMYQAIGGCLFHIMIIIIFTEPYINFTSTFLIAMSHQIFLVSFGAFTILMFLIKNNSASKTVSIFFLIPPTTAVLAWIFLNEMLTNWDLIGFTVATFGVYIATRKNKV
jgi:drug/metabolite transporter (DMT)-like permease